MGGIHLRIFLRLIILILPCNAIMSRIQESQILVKNSGETATMPCQKPEDEEAYWTHNGNIIATGTMIHDDSSRRQIVDVYLNQRDLKTRNIKITDEGEYKCKSKMAGDLKIYQLFIRGPVRLDKTSPSVSRVTENSDVSLWCNATGKPDPEVTWYVVNQYSDREEIEEIGIRGPKLEIRNITRHCTNTYRCLASNFYQEFVTVEASFEVIVLYPPSARVTGSVDNTPIADPVMFGKDGDEVVLTCEISASPMSAINWYKSDVLLATLENGTISKSQDFRSDVELFYSFSFEPLFRNQFSVHYMMEFRLDPSETFGRYTCVSSNEYGNTKISVWIKRKSDRD